MKSTSKRIALSIAAAVCVSAAQPAGAQKLYKWVDEDGNVHYSDQVPPDQVKQARERLNEQGVVVESTDRAKTQEELAVEREARAAELAAEREAERQLRADQELLATYASSADIYRVRDQQVDALDRSIEAAQSYIAGQRKSLATLLERAANNERQGREISPALRSSIDSSQEQIAEQQAFIDSKEAEKQEIIVYFEEELARFRDILKRRGLITDDAPADS
ncbi:MAG: DUF4124 domain-containing protein [Pseudomonadota bacterium]